MARDPQAALVALNRFGFGARGGASGDFTNAASDPRGFVAAELQRPAAGLIESPALQPTSVLASELFAFQAEQKTKREADAKVAAAKTAMPSQAPGAMMDNTTPTPMTPRPPKPAPNVIERTFRAEALARIQRASIAECGFLERLVTFWSNHFCVSVSKGQPARIWAGAFEREAIRPHVLGHFAEMLKAAEQHPAMLFFLDNQQSIGPNSRAGQRGKRGINENLAREIMELHTLGVGGGYTQADVVALAKILTGWTYAGPQARLGAPGSFIFNVNAHEPGAIVLLGKSYADNNAAQGEAALADIARRPATATFIATKLVRHFVADDPPPALVARLADVFMKTDGDLRAVSHALVEADDAWRAPMTKMRSPYEFLIATGRLMAQIPEDPGRYLYGLNVLGQPLWAPAGPNGFADTNAAWAAPEGMKLRLDIAAQVASRIGDNRDPREMLDLIVADAASADTRQTIARAESRQQAFALLLMSPEFQRR
ncbi:DUF1800 domain-containing protein [Nitrobacteraceae bacterium UC4446_H13]